MRVTASAAPPPLIFRCGHSALTRYKGGWSIHYILDDQSHICAEAGRHCGLVRSVACLAGWRGWKMLTEAVEFRSWRRRHKRRQRAAGGRRWQDDPTEPVPTSAARVELSSPPQPHTHSRALQVAAASGGRLYMLLEMLYVRHGERVCRALPGRGHPSGTKNANYPTVSSRCAPYSLPGTASWRGHRLPRIWLCT